MVHDGPGNAVGDCFEHGEGIGWIALVAVLPWAGFFLVVKVNQLRSNAASIGLIAGLTILEVAGAVIRLPILYRPRGGRSRASLSSWRGHTTCSRVISSPIDWRNDLQPQAGQRVGEYVLESELGRGAFGEVWRAKHHVWSDQSVAVKIPLDRQFLSRLQREGMATHQFDHPGIVRPLAFDPFARDSLPGDGACGWAIASAVD